MKRGEYGTIFGDEEYDRHRDRSRYRGRDWDDRENDDRPMERGDRAAEWYGRGGREPEREAYYPRRDEEARYGRSSYEGRGRGSGRRRDVTRYFGRFTSAPGVGSAAGYAGMGGPGWTSGGFGDPGYNTSGFGSPHYGRSRYGAPSQFRSDAGYSLRRPIGEMVSHDHEQGPHRGVGPRNYTRSTERLHEDVCDALTLDPRVDASEIEVRVENGEVTLEGTVDDREAKRIAEDCAWSVRGVRDVHNRLRRR